MSERTVVGTDGSVSGTAAVEWAADNAARRGAPLRIVSVVERWPYGIARFPAPPDVGDSLVHGAERVLAEASALRRRPGITVTTETIEGYPAEVLCEQATEATEVVVGSRGLGGKVPGRRGARPCGDRPPGAHRGRHDSAPGRMVSAGRGRAQASMR
ncbi:universal stress protein [Sphaerisporangium perillae]|uniref:universal stress protein n=1 Tax=Sphaerisporangium perillae TaxID=2935860 RepID=UPI00200F02C1|nr:universal stress protein [Sphaerisporangium perillae]